MKLRKIFSSKKSRNLSELFLDKYAPNSRFAESYRSLRTNIQFSFLDRECRSILITSAGAEEGKTASTANLAFTMAQAGKNVLMIDGDLRKPALSALVEAPNATGLSHLLSEAINVDIREGALSEFGPSDLFWLVAFQKKTGRLDLSGGGEKLSIYFLNGEIVDVLWSTRPEEKKLAALLIREKLITPEQAEEALNRGRQTGQKLGFILINLGAVKEDDLKGFLTLHMIEGIRTALQLKQGAFQFTSLSRSQFEQSAFTIEGLRQIYRQSVIGQEEFLYLNRVIVDSILQTSTERLSLLPSGGRPPNPAELLGSDRMVFLLSFLTKRFDMVIIDSPPILLTSDSVLLAPLADGVILIVKAGQMKREAVKKAVDQLEIAQANLIGIAINQVDAQKEGYYYKYYSKYYEDA